jgi:DNA-binding transcriptional LysR family regulator
MDFRLNVFISVARNLNFTRAANELHISQPAISRHIKELESTYKVQLFERSGNKVRLTAAGEVFFKYAESIAQGYKALMLEMYLLTGNLAGELQVGASTTIAQYELPPILATFISMFPNVHLSVVTGNTEQIEQALEDHKIDLGLIEGSHRKQSFKYVDFKKDELVLITNSKNKTLDEVTIEELTSLPLVLREKGSGTLEVIEEALAKHGKRLSQMNILLQLGSTESIKLFLENNTSAFALVSITAITKELMNNSLKIIEITDLEILREFSIITNHGSHNEVRDRFVQFLFKTL